MEKTIKLNTGEIKTIIHALGHLNDLQSGDDYEEEQNWMNKLFKLREEIIEKITKQTNIK